MADKIRLALLGQPNSGKSSLFNALTGSHQHVGNWPGKTVEQKTGTFTHNGITYEITDLPGSYSLSANSDEEIVTRDFISGREADLTLILIDSSQMERSMFMLADYAGINTPAMAVLTMTDVAHEQGKLIDCKKLSDELGIPAAQIVAPDISTYGNFYNTLEKSVKEKCSFSGERIFELLADGDHSGDYLKALSLVPENGIDNMTAKWLAAKLMEQDPVVMRKVSANGDKTAVKAFCEKMADGALYTSECRFAYIENVISECVKKTRSTSELLTKFDKLAISRKWGKLISLGIIIAGLIGTFICAAPIMGIGSVLPPLLSKGISAGLGALGVSEGIISFINSTLVTTIGWVLSMVGFVFGINFVFGIIEEVGYMARISYSFDGTMNKLGLQGKAIMPMLVSLGCTIGGAAGTRVVDSWGQRILTIAVLWAVPCGATFAVIPSLATAFFGISGGILVFLLIFAIMLAHMFITAKIFGRKLNPVDERTGIIMELPPYHKPRWKFIFKQTFGRMAEVFKKAFGIVLIVTVIFYFLGYSKNGGIENSILYTVGTAIEPVTKFFGMGWQTFLAFCSSMLSKEAVLGVLSAIYAHTGSIYDSTASLVSPDANIASTVASIIPKPEALAFMIAVNFNVPCLMAVSSTYQECHSLKWTLKIAAYYICSALLISCVVYHAAALFM